MDLMASEGFPVVLGMVIRAHEGLLMVLKEPNF